MESFDNDMEVTGVRDQQESGRKSAHPSSASARKKQSSLRARHTGRNVSAAGSVADFHDHELPLSIARRHPHPHPQAQLVPGQAELSFGSSDFRGDNIPEFEKRWYEQLKTIDLIVNDVGHPQKNCASVVVNELTEVVQRHVPVTVTWAKVSAEVKYTICQELQIKFKDGSRIDSKWIHKQARKIHAKARKKGMDTLWFGEYKLAKRQRQVRTCETCLSH